MLGGGGFLKWKFLAGFLVKIFYPKFFLGMMRLVDYGVESELATSLSIPGLDYFIG